MASSGTVTYRATANTIINGALRLLGAIDAENNNSPSTNQTSGGLEALNMLVKTWQTNGLQLWERKYAVIFPRVGQAVYVLGSPGPAGDHACLSTPLNAGYVQTTLSAAAASGATTISVTSVTGQLSTTGNTAVTITTAYNIGVQLDSGDLQWTTVNGAPSGTTVTLTAVLTGAAAAGNYVFCYQTKLFRPLRILDAFMRVITGGNDIPVRILSRDEYNRFGMKSSQGTAVQLYYDPQVNTGHLYWYPVPSNVTQNLFIEFQKPIEDFATSADDFDMPQEWADALKFNLARRLAPEYEVSQYKYNQIKDLADETYKAINNWDQETASIYLQPSNWDYYMDGRK